VRLELKLTPVNWEQHSEEEQAAKSATPITDRLSGILASAGDITLEQNDAEEQGAKSLTPHADFLSGILASAGDITLEQIREERLRKYM
jgi:hypothetical protein